MGAGEDTIAPSHFLHKLRRQGKETSLTRPVLDANHRQAFACAQKAHIQVHHGPFQLLHRLVARLSPPCQCLLQDCQLGLESVYGIEISDANVLALRDFFLGRFGKMGPDVARVCYGK